MRFWRFALILAAIALTGASCAPAVHYHPQPLAPAATAASLESRRLSEPGLRQFMEKNLGRKFPAWPVRRWTPEELALAATYFNPQMPVAQAQAEAAQAAIITAGERPNPTLAVMPGIPSPYLFDLAMNFLVVRAGRREIKIRQAKALSRAAGFGLAATAWKVRSGLRSAALKYFVARRRLQLARSRERLLAKRLDELSAQLAAGEVARPQVESVRMELLNSRVALRRARGQVSETRAAMAAAIGVPVAALKGISFSWTSFDRPPGMRALSPAAIRRDAVLNRLDVRQDLADYAAAQAELQLQIARQHPNFTLGPGYQFEESNNYFTLAFSAVLPIRNRNQGPIAEAEARRKEAAAHFLATQAHAIAQSEQALARYRAALGELGEARKTLAQMRNVQEPAARRSLATGESGRLSYNQVLLEGAAAASAYLDVLERAQAALGQLEDTVQRPLPSSRFAPPLHPSAQKKESP